MSDETKPPETETPAEETAEPKPKMVEIEEEELDHLRAVAGKYIQMLDRALVLNVALLEKRAEMMAEGGAEAWGGHVPGIFLQPNRCGHYKGLEAIYFRGTVSLRCRVCKRLAHRIKVAEASPAPEVENILPTEKLPKETPDV